MLQVPFISICIPTNGNVDFVLPTIESIYAQNVDISMFEVVISDNGNTMDLENKIKELNYKNLVYIRSSESGYLNQKVCLINSSGVFCKLHNHRCLFNPGSLELIISFAKNYRAKKPVVFCSDGNVKGKSIIECPTLDLFLYYLTYYTSWSGGLCIWDIDREKIKTIKLNDMFPHASILFESRDNANYVIMNKQYQVQIDDKHKGKYNLFEVFAVKYLDIIYELYTKERILKKTFKHVKTDLLNKCLCGWYYSQVLCKPSYSFDMSGIKQSLSKYYSIFDYWYMIIKCKSIYLIKSFLQSKH